MKYKIILSAVLLFNVMLLSAANGFEVEVYQTTSTQYEMNFNLDEFQLGNTVKNGVTYSTIHFEGGVTTKDAGFAEVPFIHAALQISANRNVSLEIVSTEYEEYDLSYPLLPSRGTIYRNQNPSTIPYGIAEESLVDEFYPALLAENVEPFVLRDVRGTIVYVYPFQYNTDRNVLRVYSNVIVRLTDDNTPVVNPLPRRINGITREMDSMYRTMFVNYNTSRFENELGEFGSILVIHTPRDADAIVPYVEWKQQKGFTVYVEEVATGTNVQSLVAGQYAAHDDILYVQLVGDWADIQGPISGSAATDPNLGCVVGTDVYPDLVIGRFSAGNTTDVTTQVNKSITYEKEPDANEDWYKFAVGIASSQGTGQGDDDESDDVHIQNIYDNKLDLFTYDTYTPIYDPSANASMVAAAVEEGASIINYCGHGTATAWLSSGFNNSNVNLLNNGDKLPFIISVACYNGSFQNVECFAETWLNKENGGAIGMYASTISQPWAPPMRGQDYINDLLIGGYDYSLYQGQNGITTDVQKTTYGAMCFNGSILMTMEDISIFAQHTMETWHVFGDASLQVRTDAPAATVLSNTVCLEDIDFSTIVIVDGSPFSGAIVSIYQDGNVFSSITDDTGSVTISHDLDAGDALLTVTGFNINTFIEEVEIAIAEGAFVIYEDCLIEDLAANNNGLLDYGETVDLGMTLVNVGTDLAIDVSATIACTDSFVSILNANADFGNIAVGATAAISGAFQISVDDLVPDGYSFMIVLDATDGTDLWSSNFFLTIHAPVFETGQIVVDDYGGNGMLDPGETASIFIPIINNGSAVSPDLIVDLSSATPDFAFITSGAYNINPLAVGDVIMTEFEIEVNESVEPGTIAILNFVAIGGEYEIASTFYPAIGLICENFETGDFSQFNWVQGTYEWEISTDNPFEGNFCAVSADIGDDQLATLTVTSDVLTDGEISFYRQVSSEENCDFLRFYINGSLQDQWSGNVNWSEVIFDVNAGINVEFKWEYDKNNSESNGSDCAWIDYIIFPEMGIYLGPIISVDVSEITFGIVNIGETATNEFTIFNLGTENLTGTFTVPECYNLNINDFDITVGDSMNVEVQFSPLELMNYQGCIVINSNDQINLEIEISVEGIGIGTDTIDGLIPIETELIGNYPNPFNPTTTISFNISNEQNEQAELAIYNLRGQKVKTFLINSSTDQPINSVTWNGEDDSGKPVSSGIYFYKLKSGNLRKIKKMLLMK
jgi:gingipain R